MKNKAIYYKYRDQLYKLISFNFFNDLHEQKMNEFNPSYIDVDRNEEYSIISYEKRFLMNYFGQNFKYYHLISASFGYNFIFKKVLNSISMKELKNVSYNYADVVQDYFLDNKELPVLLTQKMVDNVVLNGVPNEYKPLRKEKALKVIGRFLENKKTDKPFKKEDRKIESFKNEEKMFKAMLKGGFVEVTYNGENYEVPKLPLIALTRKKDKYSEDFDYSYYTWFFTGKRNGLTGKSLIKKDLFEYSSLPLVSEKDDSFFNELLNLSQKL